jgi:CHAT domain-containing protein/Tfp pilus assembly protein PilF
MNNRNNRAGFLAACLLATALAAQPQVTTSTGDADERAHAGSLMEEGTQLLAQRTPEALQSAMVDYRQAFSLWQKLADTGKQVEALLSQATAQFFLHRTDEARALVTQAGDVARAAGNQSSEATVLTSSALLYDSVGEEQKALDEAARSRTIFQTLADKVDEAQVLTMQANLYRKLKDTPNATASYEQALPLFRASNNRKGEAMTLLGLAQMNSLLNRPEAFEKAVAYCTEAVPLFQADSDRFNETMCWWNMGTANDRLGHSHPARDAYLKAIPFFVEKKNDSVLGRLLLNVGEDEDALGNVQKAVDYYEQALPLLKAPGAELSQGMALTRLGQARQKLGDPVRAIDAFKAAITAWHSAGDKDGEATSYLMLGAILFEKSDWKGALDADSTAFKLHESTGDRLGQAASLAAMTSIYFNLGDYKKSLELSLQWIPLLTSDPGTLGTATALKTAGDCYDKLGDAKTALEYLEKSLALSQDDPAAKAGVLDSMGDVYSGMGDQKKALELEQQAADLLRPLNKPATTNKVLNDLGLTYSAMGNKTQALRMFETSLASAHARNDLQQQSATLNNLAQTHQDFGESKQAEELYTASLALIRQVGDRYQEAGTLSNLGMVYHAIGAEQKAEDTLKLGVSIRRELADRHGEAIALGNLALFYSDTGELQKALDSYDRVQSIFKEFDDPPERATALNNLGSIYHHLGLHDRAQLYYQQALQIREQTNDDDGRTVTLNNLAVLAHSDGHPEEASEYDHQALQLAEKLGNRVRQASLLSDLGMIDSDSGDQRQALVQLNHSLELARQTGDLDTQAVALHNLGTVYEKLGDLPKALDHFHQALPLWRQVNSVEGEAITLYTTAKIERKQGNLQAALGHVEDSIRLRETLRSRLGSEDLRATLLSTAGNSYELDIAILMQLDRVHPGQGSDARALEASERARARSLLDLLTESRANIRQGVDPQLLAQEQSIKRSLNAKASQLRKLSDSDSVDWKNLNREIEEQTSAYEGVEAQIRSTSPAYAALTQPQPLSLREIQRELDPDSVLLEYALGQEQSYLWAVTPTSLFSYELPKRDAIEDAADDFQKWLKNPEGLEQAAQKLSDILLGPAASELKKKRLIVVGDELVQALVPFSALPEPSTLRAAAPETAPILLIADHEIVIEPSASAVVALRRGVSGRRRPPKVVAVLADPVFESNDERLAGLSTRPSNQSPAQLLESATQGTTLHRLPKSREEANRILGLTTPAQSLAKLDFGANKANAESPELADYRMVHFATHGLIDPAHPELSGVVLSLYDQKGQSVDGFLRLNEIFNLKLPVELVVLSACESGQGKLVGGEGLVGLTRGFMYAGAATMVVSLWKVDDEATAELMTRFYQKMLGAENLRPAAALRAAQLSMTNSTRWKHASYWASFIVEGEWR